jgi:hypothetical protein
VKIRGKFIGVGQHIPLGKVDAVESEERIPKLYIIQKSTQWGHTMIVGRRLRGSRKVSHLDIIS